MRGHAWLLLGITFFAVRFDLATGRWWSKARWKPSRHVTINRSCTWLLRMMNLRSLFVSSFVLSRK
jgi:hypothetical protein